MAASILTRSRLTTLVCAVAVLVLISLSDDGGVRADGCGSTPWTPGKSILGKDIAGAKKVVSGTDDCCTLCTATAGCVCAVLEGATGVVGGTLTCYPKSDCSRSFDAKDTQIWTPAPAPPPSPPSPPSPPPPSPPSPSPPSPPTPSTWVCDQASEACRSAPGGAYPDLPSCQNACPAVKPTAPSTGGGDSKHNSLSIGSILCIGFFCGLVIPYIVIGGAIMRVKYQESGTGLIPNKEFWGTVPGLIKDGFAFFIGKVSGGRFCADGASSATYRTL